MSFFNEFIERTIAIETANGNPSGIATTRIKSAITTDFVNKSKVSFENRFLFDLYNIQNKECATWVNRTNKAMKIAYLEIFFDSFSNFNCKKVFYS